MTIYNAVIGDPYDDGHGKFDSVDIEIPDNFTEDQLRENYKRNVERMGFSPFDLFQTYEESYLQPDVGQALLEAGCPSVYKDEDDTFNIEEETYTTPEGTSILMFFLGDGLEGFEWKVVHKGYPSLFGTENSVMGRGSYGYGLYF